MLEHAQSLWCRFSATGHARMKKDGDAYHLLKGLDTKDQSYFLYAQSKQLSHAMFPLGELAKEKYVRLLKKGFITADKKMHRHLFYWRAPLQNLIRIILAQPGDMVMIPANIRRHDTMFYTWGNALPILVVANQVPQPGMLLIKISQIMSLLW